jgi:hypothetical protein
MDRSTYTRRQARPSTSPSNRRRPLLVRQNVVPRPTTPRERNGTLPIDTRLVLSRQVRHARGGRATRLEHRGFSANIPSWVYTRRGAIGKALSPAPRWPATSPVYTPRTCPPRYRLHIDAIHPPWSSSMADTYQSLLGTDTLGVTAVILLSNSLPPSTYANYDNASFSLSVLRKEFPLYRPRRPLGSATPLGCVCSARWPQARYNLTTQRLISSSATTSGHPSRWENYWPTRGAASTCYNAASCRPTHDSRSPRHEIPGYLSGSPARVRTFPPLIARPPRLC